MTSPKASLVRQRVLEGIALNRTPGFHFAGHFLGVSFEALSPAGSRIVIDTGPHCEEADGQVNLGAIALVCDIALAACIRANLTPEQRLATVSMHLQFTGAPLVGPVEGAAHYEGMLDGGAGRQGLARVALVAGGRKAVFGSGAFMALDPPPGVKMHPFARLGRPTAPPLAEADLTPAEAEILAHADAALADATKRHGFLRRFWGQDPRRTKAGSSCTTVNGPHIGNRVGHVQGGLQVGLAATTAMAALPDTWMLSGISAWFVSPGEGPALKSRSRVVHHGRQTAVVRTEITGIGGRRVLEAVSTHALRRHD